MRKLLKLFTSGLVALIMMMTSMVSLQATSSNLKVHFIDVGAGDCIYIEYKDTSDTIHRMLIDGGYYSDYHRYQTGYDVPYGDYYQDYDKYFLKDKSGNYSTCKLPNSSKANDDYRYSSYILSNYDEIKTAIINDSKISEGDVSSYSIKPDTDTTLSKKLQTIKTNLAQAKNACTRYLDSVMESEHLTHLHFDCIINTHPHQDHISGLIPVISRSDISYDQIYDNTPDGTTYGNSTGFYYYSGWAIYFNLIADFNSEYHDNNGTYKHNTIPTQGSVLSLLGNDTDAPSFTVLSDSPQAYIASSKFSTNASGETVSAVNATEKTNSSLWDCAINNTSIVLRMDYKNNSFLFTGDMEVAKQNNIIDHNITVGGVEKSGMSLVQTDVIDVVHHGNSNNDFKEYDAKSGDFHFYQNLHQAKYAIIQCGSDHDKTTWKPRPKVTSDLKIGNPNINIYTTKESGNIDILTDGTNLSVNLANGQTHHYIVYKTVAAKYHVNGSRTYVCDQCADSYYTETLPMTHKESYTAVITAASHFSAGVMGHYCSCGTLLSTSAIAQQSHSIVRSVTAVASTLTTAGVKINYCSCGVEVSRTTISKTTSKTLYKGKKTTLVAGVSGKLKWSSSKSSVASVSSKGVVTAKKAGTATITLKRNGKKVATCKITVKTPTLKVSKTSVTLKKGTSTTVTASCSPSGTISWSSSNKKVATVNGGRITAKKKGSCKITVKCNGVSKKITVKVK